MSPVDLIAWVGAVALSLVIALVAAAIIAGCVRAIRGPQKFAPVAPLRPAEPRYKRTTPPTEPAPLTRR